jgi:HEAT repeat protein
MTKKPETTRRYSETHRTGVDRFPDDAELIENLTNSDLKQRLNAQYKLISRGHEAVPALLEALKDNDPHLRSNAAQVLAVVADPTAAEGLAAALDDDEDPVRWVAAEGLIALGPFGLQAALHALLNADTISPQLRAAVRHILLRLRDAEGMEVITRPLLAAIHEFEMNEKILVEAYRALTAIEGYTSVPPPSFT